MDTSYVYEKIPERIYLVGSCNGVVCLKLVYFDDFHDLILWNRETKEVNYLPAAASTAECESFSNGYTVGFDAHTSVHKVVWLKKYSTSDRQSVTARIFSKNNMPRRWRQLKGLIRFVPIPLPWERVNGLTIDGVMYWVAHTFNVLSFDLSKEKFREFDGPVSHRMDDGFQFKLINWKGSVGALLVKPGAAEIHLWFKNKDTSNSENGWNKISTIQPFLGPLQIGRVFGTPVFLKPENGALKRFLYDLVTKEKRDLEEGSLTKLWWLDISEHFDTLISPN